MTIAKLGLNWITFVLAISIFGAIELEIKQAFAEGNATHVTRSVAHPHRAKIMHSFGVTKYFEFHVHGGMLSQLTFEIPNGIRFNSEVQVSDEIDESIDASIAIEGDTLSIVFSEPVAPDRTVKIALEKVKSRGWQSSVWLYPVTARYVEMNADIPIGTARIQTYD